MRLPGEAWLEFRIEPDPRDGSRSVLHQHALFLPRGLAGQVYWWSVLPFHGIVFEDMLRNLARAAGPDVVLVAKGKGAAIRKVADALLSEKGVKHGKLTMTTTGKGLSI